MKGAFLGQLLLLWKNFLTNLNFYSKIIAVIFYYHWGNHPNSYFQNGAYFKMHFSKLIRKVLPLGAVACAGLFLLPGISTLAESAELSVSATETEVSVATDVTIATSVTELDTGSWTVTDDDI